MHTSLNTIFLTILFGVVFLIANAQDKTIKTRSHTLLSKKKAVEITFKNNYNIRVLSNAEKIAQNNKTLYNSGFLPKIYGSAAINRNYAEEFEGKKIPGAEIHDDQDIYEAEIGIDYKLFSGFSRVNIYKRFRELYNLSQVQARQVIENTLIDLFLAYHEVARLTENESKQLETLKISKQRLKRSKYRFEYGQNTKLDILNAEVDVNKDSVNLLNITQKLANSKRDLNVILGRANNTAVEADTIVNYNNDLNLSTILKDAAKNNASLIIAEETIKLNEYNIKIKRARRYPTIGVTSSFNWDQRFMLPPSPKIKSVRNNVLNSLYATWNLFDGGRTRIDVKNAKIARDNSKILRTQLLEQLKRDVNNAWETHQNALFILKVQKKNVETNKRNFKRSDEQYKLGQISSIDFRQAQINLINAELDLSNAKYNAKNAELLLLKFAGSIIDYMEKI